MNTIIKCYSFLYLFIYLYLFILNLFYGMYLTTFCILYTFIWFYYNNMIQIWWTFDQLYTYYYVYTFIFSVMYDNEFSRPKVQSETRVEWYKIHKRHLKI